MINYQKFIDDNIEFIKAIKYLGPVESEFIKATKPEQEEGKEDDQDQSILILINETDKCTIMYEDCVIEDLMAINIKSDTAEMEFKDGTIMDIVLPSGYLQINEYPPTAKDESDVTVITITKKEYPDYVYMDRSKLKFPVTKTEMVPRADGSYIAKISAYLNPKMLNPVPIYASLGEHSKLPRILNEIAVIAFDVANTEIQFIEGGYIVRKGTSGFTVDKILSFENNGIHTKSLMVNNSDSCISYMDIFKQNIPIVDPNCILVDCSDHDNIKFIDSEIFKYVDFEFTEQTFSDFSDKLSEMFNVLPSQNKLLKICSGNNIEKETRDTLIKILKKIQEAFEYFNQIITDYPFDDFLAVSGQSLVRINNTSLNNIYNEAFKYIDNYLHWLKEQESGEEKADKEHTEDVEEIKTEEIVEETDIKEAIAVEETEVEVVTE